MRAEPAASELDSSPRTHRDQGAAIALPLLILALGLAACGDSASGPAQPFSEEILAEERVLVDEARPTRPNGDYAGAPTRMIPTRLWYRLDAPSDAPACGRGGCSLVLLAHGFGGSTARFDAYARALALAGYVVAAPTFPLTNERAPGGIVKGLSDVTQQPGDLSFTVDELLAAAGDPADPLHGRLDRRRAIGLVGHSLGGATAAAATRSACCTDARIAADVLVAPAVGLVESVFETTLSTAGPATLVVNGTLDTAIPVEVSRVWWATLESPAAFLAVPGAHHGDLIENSGDPSPFLDPTERASIGFFDAFLGGDRGALDTAFAGLREEGYEPLGP